ncbi:14288_t:CDS:2, partial [Entrophospora sp. SA101]
KRIQQQQRGQICDSCDQQNHFHKEIIACSECGYPEPKVDNLYHIAVEFLKCPDYNEIIENINLELNKMDINDQDYEKLIEIKEDIGSDNKKNNGENDVYEVYKTYNNRYSRVYDIARLSILGSLNDM